MPTRRQRATLGGTRFSDGSQRTVVHFEKNVGGTDRLVRGVLGATLLLAGLAAWTSDYRVVGALVLAVGLGLLVNAVTQFCTVNALLGVNTCERRDGE